MPHSSGSHAIGPCPGPDVGSAGWRRAQSLLLAPPTNIQQEFLGTWNLTWDDPVNPDCPCHGTLTVQTQGDGELKGYWPMKGGAAVLFGEVAYDNNVWTGRFAQPDDLDFPIKGHFRLEARSQDGGLTGSYQRDGTSIAFRWSATRR
jgi:hypothetical protein